MTFNEFQDATHDWTGWLDKSSMTDDAVLGLSSTVGAMAQMLGDFRYHAGEYDEDYLMALCGEVLYYVSEMVSSRSLKLDMIAKNTANLYQERYNED